MSWVKAGEWYPVDDDDYRLRIEEMRDGDQQMVFVHLTVKLWSPRVLKRLKHDFSLLRQSIPCPLYTYSDKDDEKWSAFLSHFGWQFLTDVLLENGERRRLFVHLKEPLVNDRSNQFSRERTDGEQHGQKPVVRADAVPSARLRRRQKRAAALAAVRRD